MISKARIESNRNYWLSAQKRYGPNLYYAKSISRRPRPENVDHAFSACFEDGWRVYAFATERDRDKFVVTWQDYGAEKCEDPCSN